MDITGRVLGVTGHPTRNNSMRYAVAFSDGNEYNTFDNALAKKANGFVNQEVDVRVNVQQKGQYTNRYLNDIAPVGQLPLEDMQAAAGQEVDGIQIVQPQTRRGGGGNRGMSEADKTRISKLGAIGDAFNFIGLLYQGAGPEGFEEAKKQAFDLAHEMYNAARSHEMSQPQVQAQVSTPQEIAAAVPGVQVGVPEAGGNPSPEPEW